MGKYLFPSMTKKDAIERIRKMTNMKEHFRESVIAMVESIDRRTTPSPKPKEKLHIPKDDIEYPCHIFDQLISKNSPYAWYLFQWVPYQTDAKKWRLKMQHDVKHFDGRIEMGVWPNGTHCGSFHDNDVEFIRISKNQFSHEWVDPRNKTITTTEGKNNESK